MSKLVELVGRGKLSVTSASDLANSIAASLDLRWCFQFQTFFLNQMILFQIFLFRFPSPVAQGRGPPNSQQSTAELCCLGVTRQMCGQCRARPPQMAAGSLGVRAPSVWDFNTPTSRWVDYSPSFHLWPQHSHFIPFHSLDSTPFHCHALHCITCVYIYIYIHMPMPSYNQTRHTYTSVSLHNNKEEVVFTGNSSKF